ncbi:MAG: energy transducer TonB [Candidatus Acidiferrales bacterium]
MSELGGLSQCLVDSDSDARSRSRRLRGKALVLSIVFEAALLAAIILWPLFSPGVLATQYIVTPTPPYSGGGGAANHSHAMRHHSPASALLQVCRAVCAPVIHPSAPLSNSEPPDIDLNESESAGNGGGPGNLGVGPGVPGGLGDRTVVPEPPHAEEPQARPTRLSEGVMAALLVHRVDPSYPRVARAMHLSGVVHLHAIIGKDGAVRELAAVDGNPILANAAKAAVQNWRYRPTMLSGEAVEVETYITVNFVLN